ncbi:MAG: PAS domain S-box protein [Xanthomarina sp.]
MQDKIRKELLKQQEPELLTSLKNHILIVLTDHSGEIIYATDKFSKLKGVSKEISIGQANRMLKSHGPTKIHYKDICNALHAGKLWKGMFSNKTGIKKYWLQTTIRPLKSSNGNADQYFALNNDTSNYFCNKTNSQEIYNKEKMLIENFRNEVLYINNSGKIINTSKSVLNNSYSSIVGFFIYDFVNPSNHEYLKKQMEKVFQKGKTAIYQSIGLSAKGKQIFFITKIKPVENLHKEVIYATISSKKYKKNLRVKEDLKAIESKYRNIFQSINAGIIVVTNSQGDIIEWNKGAEFAFGYTESEIIGEPLTILISKKHVDTGVQELLKAVEKLDNNIYGENIEMLGLKKNGQEFPVEFAVNHWRNGKEKFYCAIMLDISKRKKLDERLKATTKDLELFLYRSAHDLKAPLTSVEGLLNLLKEEKLEDKAVHLIEMLDETLEKGRLLLDDLAFASIISEKKRDVSIIDFKDEISQVLTGLSAVENFEKIAFHTEIHHTIDFHFNPELVKFIFKNLLQNAILYSRPLTENHLPKIQIQVKTIENNIHIIITDNGLGISEEHINRIFELYYKISGDNNNGTGLGLYIIKRIVQDLNGDILVKSELNQGTLFEVILPNLL